MQDTAFYQFLLDMQSPWTVSRVTLRQRGLVSRACGDRDVDAPVLRENTAALLPGRGKTWRHLDSCHFQAYLYARIPRVVCGEHGMRLPEHRILRVGDLLLLRRVRSLPMLDLEVPLFRSRAEM
jgi:transposase